MTQKQEAAIDALVRLAGGFDQLNAVVYKLYEAKGAQPTVQDVLDKLAADGLIEFVDDKKALVA